MVWKLARCEIAIRSGPSDLWRFQPSIRLNEVYKLAKYEAPFLAQPVVTAGGHEKGRSQSRKAPFRGFGDRDLESRDASSPDSQNVKS
jgi:hypothetical protein